MKIEIPNIGIAEFEKLPDDYCWGAIGDENYNFAWVTVNGHKCIICDPGNSVALAEMLLDDEPFAYNIFTYMYPDMSYWWFVRNESCCEGDATELCISQIFEVLLDFNIIQEVHSEDLKEVTKFKQDFVYVFPDYDKFNLKERTDIRLAMGKASIEDLKYAKESKDELLEEQLDFCDDEEEEKDLKKEFKQDYLNTKKFLFDELRKLEEEKNNK